MLDVKILKVDHIDPSGINKLAPHLENLDVFSGEGYACTEEVASKDEASWENLLKANYASEVSDKVIDKRFSHFPDAAAPYLKNLHKNLYANKTLLWGLERYTEPASNTLMSMQASFSSNIEQAYIALERIDFSRFSDQYKKFLANSKLAGDMRDKGIGANLNIAEERIRARYPIFKEKNVINFGVLVGALHNPEEYTDLSCKIINLAPERDLLDDVIDKKFNSEGHYDGLEEDLMRLAVDYLAEIEMIDLKESASNLELPELKSFLNL